MTYLRHLALLVAVLVISLAVGGVALAQEQFPDANTFYNEYRDRSVFIEVFEQGAPNGAPIATGSGVLLQSGYVLTSLHVVGETWTQDALEDGLPDLKITGRVGFSEGKESARLELVDQSRQHDLALLQFNPELSRNYAYACVETKPPKVGKQLAILGFPLGKGLMLSTGMVSGIETNQILTHATVAPGSSGSAVYDEQRRVIGIVRAEIAKGGQGTDIYVIVPIKRASGLLDSVDAEDGDPCNAPVVEQAGGEGLLSLDCVGVDTSIRDWSGPLAAAWCRDSATLTIEGNGRLGGAQCGGYLPKYGKMLQRTLTIKAISDAKAGNYDLAVEKVSACQCHNPGWWKIVQNSPEREAMLCWMKKQ